MEYMDTRRRVDVGFEYGAGLLTAECSQGTRRLTFVVTRYTLAFCRIILDGLHCLPEVMV